MNLKDLGKPLDIDQIDFRIQSINKGGFATILAYKDARVDMDRLDQVVGRGKWQRKHEIIDGQLFCSVGIYNEQIKEWVWVQDVGTESNTEKEKGRASDSFKRACFNLGIGRELYQYPVISVKLFENEFKEEEWQGKKKIQATWALKLKEWVWTLVCDDQGVKHLSAKDQNKKERFTYTRADGEARKPATETGSNIPQKTYEEWVDEYGISIARIKTALLNEDLSTAAEEWFTLSDEAKMGLWRAPTKGGCFTTKEREIIKSTEFRVAYYGTEQPA